VQVLLDAEEGHRAIVAAAVAVVRYVQRLVQVAYEVGEKPERLRALGRRCAGIGQEPAIALDGGDDALVVRTVAPGDVAVGAIFGAINTMYAAVAARRSEIAVLLTLGFHPRSVLASFLAESALIAVVGGVVGALLALPINGIVTSTTNWASFSEIAFSFRVTPALLLAGMAFAVVMGLVGGYFPARRAAKMAVVQALR
jgi:hypothetical protein